jgi:hypothetical protein
MAGIDFSGLPDKMKGYSLKEGETLLSTILIDDQEFLQYMDLLVDVADEQALTQMFIDSVLQPGGKDTFNAKGTAQFKNRIGKVRACKIDFTLTPKQINAMWKGYLGRINKSKRGDVYDAPFQQYILDKIASKGKEEIRLAAMFKGVYDEDSNNANRVFDGLLPLLSDAGVLAASQIFAGAPVTQANAIDQLEGVADKVPSHLVNTDLVALVEPDIAKFYNRDYRATYGTKQDYAGFEHKLLDGTRIEIVPEPGLAETGGIVVTPRNNLVWMTGVLNSQDAFIIEKRRRNIDIMADFEAAPDLAIAEYVWCNDLALNKGKAYRTAAAAE